MIHVELWLVIGILLRLAHQVNARTENKCGKEKETNSSKDAGNVVGLAAAAGVVEGAKVGSIAQGTERYFHQCPLSAGQRHVSKGGRFHGCFGHEFHALLHVVVLIYC